jgi:hypothetical protein
MGEVMEERATERLGPEENVKELDSKKVKGMDVVDGCRALSQIQPKESMLELKALPASTVRIHFSS